MVVPAYLKVKQAINNTSAHSKLEAEGALKDDAASDAPRKLNKHESCSSDEDKSLDAAASKKQKVKEQEKEHGTKAPSKETAKPRSNFVLAKDKIKGLTYISIGNGKFRVPPARALGIRML